jgi:selenocysteine lyase/cysteine desulfurase
MGYGAQSAGTDTALARQYRAYFPVTARLVYMNHAGVAPLSKPAADAMKRFTEDALEFGALHYDDWLATYEGLRAAAARLIGACPDEIAIVKNTSEGIATVATGLDWRAGDRVVAFAEEFPANYFPWKLLESEGVRVAWLSVHDPLERIEQACRGARLLAISFVQYLSGYRADLEAIGKICRRHDCLFFVDAIQGLGAFPLDVQRAGIDALAADGHKWLLGPEGCGVLYVRRAIQEMVRPKEIGWTNFAGYTDYASRDTTLRADAGRYECGTLNTVGCFGLRASIEFLLSVGVGRIGDTLLRLTEHIAAGVKRKGYEVLPRGSAENGSGIVSFRREGVDSETVVRALRRKGIVLAARQGWVRASPHFYISEDDVDRLLAELP